MHFRNEGHLYLREFPEEHLEPCRRDASQNEPGSSPPVALCLSQRSLLKSVLLMSEGSDNIFTALFILEAMFNLICHFCSLCPRSLACDAVPVYCLVHTYSFTSFSQEMLGSALSE